MPATPLSAEDQLAISDVLYRFGAGQDLRDTALFTSAFTDDATLDFVQPARVLGVELPPFVGRQAIESIMQATAPLVTTHTVTNARIEASGNDAATLFALVEAQHVPRADRTRHLLLKNFYWVDVVRSGDGWRARHVRVESAWWHGMPDVLFPAN